MSVCRRFFSAGFLWFFAGSLPMCFAEAGSGSLSSADFSSGTFLSAGMVYHRGTGVYNYLFADFSANYTDSMVSAEASGFLSEMSRDITFRYGVMPLKAGRFRFGFSALIHCGWLRDDISEYDTACFFDIVFRYGKTGRCWSVYFSSGVDVKNTIISGTPQTVPALSDTFFLFELKTEKEILGRAKIFLSFASFEPFRIPQFLAPVFSFGGVYALNENFRFGFDMHIRFSDMLTLTAYITGIQAGASAMYRFPHRTGRL